MNMDPVKQLSRIMHKYLNGPDHDDPLKSVLHLGEETPMRAQIALDILSKSIDTTKLVRVERTVISKGKSYVTHKWVLPDKVKKGDVILQNKAAYEKWQAENKKDEKIQVVSGGSEKQKTAPGGKMSPMAKLAAKKKQNAVKPKSVKAASPKPDHTVPKDNQMGDKPDETDAEKQKPVTEKPATKKPTPKKTAARKTAPKKPEKAEADKTGVKEVFADWNCDYDLVYQTFKDAGLKVTDNLSSGASLNAAVKSLMKVANAGPAFYKAAVGKVLQHLIIQHNRALHGKEAEEKKAEKYKDSEAAKYYDPQIIAASINAWSDGKHSAIRAQSIIKKPEEDPVNNLYSQCLTDMIRHSSTVQKGVLYRGIHVDKSFLTQVIQNESIDMSGLVSTSANAATARKFALNTADDEVPVVLEFPKSLKMKMLDMGNADNESLLSTHGSFSVKGITMDSDGIFHVRLKTKGATGDDPIADDNTYAALGMEKPKDEVGGITQKLFLKYVGETPKYTTFSALTKSLPTVFQKHGIDGVVGILTMYAKANEYNHMWLERFADTKTGYDPALIEFTRSKWIHTGYKETRKMEKTEIDSKSSGTDICFKIFNNVLNALVEKDGKLQPSMLYRGMNSYGNGIDLFMNAQVGDSIPLGGIASFSGTDKIAKNFAGQNGIMLKIAKKSKVSCAYVEGLGEDEYLVRDAYFKVTKRESKGSLTVLTIEPSN